ncbi:MAG: hypothetical protein MRZ42_00995 [Tenericutes bacterium]|nr:hypothetical protein [Mycoplasmatota bacterium]
MNIEKVRNKINSYKGQTMQFRFNGSRNQIEEFSATIIDTYPSVFIVKVIDSSLVKSFSYSDVLIRKLVVTQV